MLDYLSYSLVARRRKAHKQRPSGGTGIKHASFAEPVPVLRIGASIGAGASFQGLLRTAAIMIQGVLLQRVSERWVPDIRLQASLTTLRCNLRQSSASV